MRDPEEPLQNTLLCLVCLVAQLCLTLSDPVDYSLPGFSVHGDSPGKNTGVGCPPPGDLPNPVIELRSPALQADSLLSEPPDLGQFKNLYFQYPPVVG